jgi:hypothetical protein
MIHAYRMGIESCNQRGRQKRVKNARRRGRLEDILEAWSRTLMAQDKEQEEY